MSKKFVRLIKFYMHEVSSSVPKGKHLSVAF